MDDVFNNINKPTTQYKEYMYSNHTDTKRQNASISQMKRNEKRNEKSHKNTQTSRSTE